MFLLPYFWCMLPAMIMSPIPLRRSAHGDMHCCYCGQAGHLAKDCPIRAKEREYAKGPV